MSVFEVVLEIPVPENRTKMSVSEKLTNQNISFRKMNEPSLDVVGIGNAIVDVLTTTNDSLLESLSFEKGSMTLIDENKAKELYEIASNGIQKSGGSVANSLACVAELGGKAGFIGRVRNDKLGKIFTEEISRTGTIFKTPSSSMSGFISLMFI